VPAVAHVAPAALSIPLANVLAPADPANPINLAIDYLGALPHVHTTISIEFNAVIGGATRTYGPITFPDVPVDARTRTRVIPETALLAALNPLVAADLAAHRLQPRGVLTAGMITIAPQLDGIPLEPVILTNAFAINLVDQRAAAPDGAALARSPGRPAAGRGGMPPALRPGAPVVEPPAPVDPGLRRASRAASGGMAPATPAAGPAGRSPEQSRRPRLLHRLTRGFREPSAGPSR
jgi:hypothetical protein